jgi:hypothetical protein
VDSNIIDLSGLLQSPDLSPSRSFFVRYWN